MSGVKRVPLNVYVIDYRRRLLADSRDASIQDRSTKEPMLWSIDYNIESCNPWWSTRLIGVPVERSSLRRGDASFFDRGVVELCEREMELCTHVFFSPPWTWNSCQSSRRRGTAGDLFLACLAPCLADRLSPVRANFAIDRRNERTRGRFLSLSLFSLVFPLFFFSRACDYARLQRTVGDRDEGWVVCRDGIAGAPLIYPFTHPCWRPGSCKGAPTLLADRATGRGPSFSLLFALLGLYLPYLSPCPAPSLFFFLLHRFSHFCLSFSFFLSRSRSLLPVLDLLADFFAPFCSGPLCPALHARFIEMILDDLRQRIHNVARVADPMGSRLERA